VARAKIMAFVYMSVPMERLVLLLLLGATSCSAAVGVTGGRFTSGSPRWNGGTHLQARLAPLGDRNVLVGIDQRNPIHWGADYCCDESRTGVFLGYGQLPAREGSRLGFEAGGTFGLGKAPFADQLRYSAALGLTAAAPLRVSPSRAPWAAAGVADAYVVIVPEISVAELRPFDGPGRRWRLEVTAGLALRCQLSSSLLP
jgi:hypothetical protein